MAKSKSFQLDLPEEDRKQIKQIKCRSWNIAARKYNITLGRWFVKLVSASDWSMDFKVLNLITKYLTVMLITVITK